jgi:hypothetical protein
MRDARERHGLLRLEQVMIDFIRKKLLVILKWEVPIIQSFILLLGPLFPANPPRWMAVADKRRFNDVVCIDWQIDLELYEKRMNKA